MLNGIAMLGDVDAAARFAANHSAIEVAVLCQLAFLLSIIGVAVLKPGEPKPEVDR